MRIDTSSFIAQEYLPDGVVLQDPRNMHLNDIRKFLRHCYSRQAESGPESAFRFSLYVGRKRKQLSADYPDTSNKERNRRKKKKGKGKQREDSLEGLIQIDQSEEPLPVTEEQNTNPGPSNIRLQTISGTRNGLVRIDMGQMLKLKDMGYEALGPVNGPNEGYPEYEVPTAVLAMLKRAPHPSEPESAMRHDTIPDSVIDPALLEQAKQTGQSEPSTSFRPTVLPNDAAESDIHLMEIFPTRLRTGTTTNATVAAHPDYAEPTTHSTRSVRPTTPENENMTESGMMPRTPKTRLGKRAQAQLSPPAVRETRGKNKKKKITDDDRAALEALHMVQSGSRRRTKVTRQR